MSLTTITRAEPAPSAVARPTRSARAEHNRAGWIFSTPFLVIYAIFLVGPVLVGLVVSFFNTATVAPGLGEWVGLDNYAEVLGDGEFWASMWHSTLFTLLTTPLLVVLPLVAAMLAARVSRNQWFFRLAFFAPYVVPSSIVCLIFAFMYTPETGLISHAFGWVGLTAPDFLGSVNGAWFSVVMLTVWWTFGFNFILYLAAIMDIPEDIYEAAALDGTSPLQQMRHLTIPMVRSTISLVVLLQVLASLKVFDQIYLLLAGGPDKATRPAIEYIYDTGFTSYRGGYAAAATMVYFLALVLVAVIWALLRRGRKVEA
ncbi:MAG: carbohydrate ABC transporter permease [Nocardioides sp.]|uniref:carbohydrate ABC transporter permease n=1 Tax=Nocardioides sp. TaxID=35761 RepID=UPI003D6AEAB2